VDLLLGDPAKAREKLGWRHKVAFADLVSEMVQADRKNVAQQKDRRDWHG
jgi:GDPmannose 4,6-dehydratase